MTRTTIPSAATFAARPAGMCRSAGLTNQEICDRLWLSMSTVKTHIGNLIAKTHSRDRVQLVLFAFRTGIASTGTAT